MLAIIGVNHRQCMYYSADVCEPIATFVNVLGRWLQFIHVRDSFRGWAAQGFPTPVVDFPSLEVSKYTHGIVLKYWNMS